MSSTDEIEQKILRVCDEHGLDEPDEVEVVEEGEAVQATWEDELKQVRIRTDAYEEHGESSVELIVRRVLTGEPPDKILAG